MILNVKRVAALLLSGRDVLLCARRGRGRTTCALQVIDLMAPCISIYWFTSVPVEGLWVRDITKRRAQIGDVNNWQRLDAQLLGEHREWQIPKRRDSISELLADSPPSLPSDIWMLIVELCVDYPSRSLHTLIVVDGADRRRVSPVRRGPARSSGVRVLWLDHKEQEWPEAIRSGFVQGVLSRPDIPRYYPPRPGAAATLSLPN
jgi:hypothetical protein